MLQAAGYGQKKAYLYYTPNSSAKQEILFAGESGNNTAAWDRGREAKAGFAALSCRGPAEMEGGWLFTGQRAVSLRKTAIPAECRCRQQVYRKMCRKQHKNVRNRKIDRRRLCNAQRYNRGDGRFSDGSAFLLCVFPLHGDAGRRERNQGNFEETPGLQLKFPRMMLYWYM